MIKLLILITMGKALLDFGMQLGQQVVGMGIGKWAADQADKRQIKQQQALTDMQFGANKRLMDINYQKQLEMWEKTNYGAQKEQMQKAGLNPGLLYGMSGGGGTTTGSGGASVGGGSAPGGGGEIMGMGLAAAQMGLLKAQKENIEADTENKTADTGLKGEQTKNTTADTALKEINWNIAAIQEKIAGDTQNAVVARVLTELRTATAAMHTAETQNKITQATAKEAEEKIKLDTAIAAADNELKKAQRKATEAGTQKTVEEIEKIKQEVINMKNYWDLDNYIEREKVRLMDKGINVAIISATLGAIVNFAGRQR